MISRELALEALSALDGADKFISRETGYVNKARRDTIDKLCDDLNVKIVDRK